MKATNRICEMVPHMIGDAYHSVANKPYAAAVRTDREGTFKRLQAFAANNNLRPHQPYCKPADYYEDT